MNDQSTYISMPAEKRFEVDPYFRAVVESYIRLLENNRMSYDCLCRAANFAEILYERRKVRNNGS
jgi:hypothetical protein